MLSVSPSITVMSWGGIPSSFADDLRERRLVALALRLHAELEDRLARRVDAQLRRVEHLDPEDVVVLARARADDLGEARKADPDQAPLLARLPLLLAQRRVADTLQRLVQRCLVVARVVLEAGRRVVRELLRPDEVLAAQLGRIDVELVGRGLDQPLDQVRGLGDAERAAVRDASRRLVRVRAVGDDVRRRDVVRAGDDVEEPRAELRRLRVRVRVALVGEHLHAQPRHLPLARERELGVHVEVAREAGRDQVAGAVLDPLHRPADQQRGRRRDDVARVDRHLVAEAAADVRRDDLDVLLRQARHEREHRAVDVRRLRGHVDR